MNGCNKNTETQFNIILLFSQVAFDLKNKIVVIFFPP